MYKVLPTVTALIINRDGKVLIGKRVGEPPKPYIGRYALVGGKIEIDEDPFEALCREVIEETGLKVKAGRLLAVYHHKAASKEAIQDMEGGPGLNICWLVDEFDSKILKEESDLNNLEWLTIEEALSRKLTPWDRHFLSRYLEEL